MIIVPYVQRKRPIMVKVFHPSAVFYPHSDGDKTVGAIGAVRTSGAVCRKGRASATT